MYICEQKVWNWFCNEKDMRTNDSIKNNEVLDLTKQGLSTFYNIAQMARYRCLYTLGTDFANKDPLDNAIELEFNRAQMLKHMCLDGLGIGAYGIV